MKRIQQACICQTLHFMLKEDVAHEDAVRQVAIEVRRYKDGLKNHGITHRILEETTRPDGSVILRIIKQYNQSPVGDYLD